MTIPLRQRVLDELQRRNDAPTTARGYVLAIKQFAEYFGNSPERLGGDEIRQFEPDPLREKRHRIRSTRSRSPVVRDPSNDLEMVRHDAATL